MVEAIFYNNYKTFGKDIIQTRLYDDRGLSSIELIQVL